MKLYVGNLPWSIDDKALKKLFEQFGDIEEVVLITDKYSGRSKGFGFITFTDDAVAQKAISEMHEKEIDGRALTVSEAKPMVPRDNARRDDDSRDDDSRDDDSSDNASQDNASKYSDMEDPEPSGIPVETDDTETEEDEDE